MLCSYAPEGRIGLSQWSLLEMPLRACLGLDFWALAIGYGV